MSEAVLDIARSLMPHRGMRALYVAALGSRGHGTAVPGSDHDLVAVTAMPPDAYVSLAGVPTSAGTRARGDVSVVFLDLRHAAAIAMSGNLTIHEAVRSPSVALDGHGVGAFLRDVSGMCARPRVLASHHRTQMGRVRRAMLRRETDPPKAWVQLLREALAVRHVLATETPAPLDYRTLATACDDPGLSAVALRVLDRRLSGFADGPDGDDLAVAMAAHDAAWACTGLAKGTVSTPPPGLVARVDAFLAATLLG